MDLILEAYTQRLSQVLGDDGTIKNTLQYHINGHTCVVHVFTNDCLAVTFCGPEFAGVWMVYITLGIRVQIEHQLEFEKKILSREGIEALTHRRKRGRERIH